MIKLQSENLILRSLVDSDWSVFLEMNLSAEVNRYIRPPVEEKEIRAKFEQCKNPWHYQSGTWLTLEDFQGEFVGFSGFKCINIEYNDVEVGYMMAPSAQGKGYATEALKFIIKWGINEFNIHKFIAYCDVDNIGSQRVLQKSGFRQEGVLREHVKNGQRWIDDCVFGLLSCESV